MPSENENCVLEASDLDDFDFDLDLDDFDFGLESLSDQKDIEQFLTAKIEENSHKLDQLDNYYNQMMDSQTLVESIGSVIRDQITNQLSITQSEDFIQNNHGMSLDLSKDAHIQTTENFETGKIATHNHYIDYSSKREKWQSNFQKDENGAIQTHETRSGRVEATLVKGARAPFDKERPSGSAKNHTDIDHTIAATEFIRNPEVNTHLSQEEAVKFANSNHNLLEIDSGWNRSKGDLSTKEWLQTPNRKGQKPKEIFDISDEWESILLDKDKNARRELNKLIERGKKRSVKTGKKTRKEEFVKIGSATLRTALLTISIDLLKEVVAKLVLWLKSKKKSVESLLTHLRSAFDAFTNSITSLLVNVSADTMTTVFRSIYGPVVDLIKSFWNMLKQGGKALKEAIQFLTNPSNRTKPLNYIIAQVSIIVTGGLSGAGAIALSELIEKKLMFIPFLATEIPMIGRPANLFGVFLGSLISGVIGAIIIYAINRFTSRKLDSINRKEQIIHKNNIHVDQLKLIGIKNSQAATIQHKTYQELKYSYHLLDRLIENSFDATSTDVCKENKEISREEFSNLLQE